MKSAEKGLKNKKSSRLSPRLIAVGIGALLVISGVLFFGLENDFLKQLFNQTPRLAVNRDKIDFGVLKYGTRKTFNFTVNNIGNTELKFQKLPYIEIVQGC